MKEEKTIKVLVIVAVVIGFIWIALCSGYYIQLQSKKGDFDTLIFHSYSIDSTSVKLIVKGDTLYYFHSENNPKGSKGPIYHVIYNPKKK